MIAHSFCVPLYHPEPGHFEALARSISGQRARGSMVVVTDDAPTPQMPETISHLFGSAGAYVANSRRLGMTGNWNRSVELATTPFVTLTGQDDAYAPEYVGVLSAIFEESPDVIAVACGRDLVGKGAERRARVNDRGQFFTGDAPVRLAYSDVLYLTLRNGNPVGEPACVMFRRDAWKKIGGFDDEMEHAADVDFWLRMAELGDVIVLPDRLVQFRRHSGSQTTRNIESGAVARDRARLWRRYFSRAVLGHHADRCVAAMQTYVLLDAVRALRGRRWDDVRVALRLAREVGIPRPAALWERVVELMKGRNLDAFR